MKQAGPKNMDVLHMIKPAPNTISPWYDGAAESSGALYAPFPTRASPRCTPRAGRLPLGKQGTLTVEFTVGRHPRLGPFNGGRPSTLREAFVPGGDGRPGRDRPLLERHRRQRRPGDEVRLVRDEVGHLQQITPMVLIQGYTDPDRAAAGCVFDAMMQMRKIDDLRPSRRRGAR